MHRPPIPRCTFFPVIPPTPEELATLLPLRRFSAEYGVAVIIPDGENSFYTDHPERCALFSSYVGDELVRVTRRMLPCLSTRREDTWIGGISMGGYGALINGLRYSDTFSKIGMLSPAAGHVLPRTERCSPEARFTGSPCWRCWEIRSTITGRTAIMRLRCARP